ncbi:MAG: redox-regulated ATPase YchF [Nanoarchaeota archaeon]|nr:redox-regulated ATPase YchF [Nanoarchaeota archaeon]MBU1631945.1 redox-regulated ATPase YchF [Nanoarchaeota archaeon]MBU1875506.1 redox-regulated ATPase YchF [Nanoarchaeota archaeon]
MIIGIVGKANVGKSTFFKAATLAEVEIANYPFATIKPNSGVGYVKINDPAKDFGKVSNPKNGFILKEFRFVPIQMIDVAGLVPGAHEGKGMGNQFLDDLRQADVLIHVIDVSGSTNEKGEPIQPGSRNPAEDVKFLEVELDMWYLGILKKGWEKFARTVIQEKMEIHLALGKQLSGLKVTENMIEDTIKELKLNKEKPHSWTEEELKNLAVALRKKTKPMIIACNKIDVPVAEKNLLRLKEEFPDRLFVGCSAESELALREAAKVGLIEYIPGEENFKIIDDEKLNEKQKKALEFIKTNILAKYGATGVQSVLDTAVFDLLKYIAIFPGGVSKLEDSEGRCLPDCFLMPPDTTALDFAFKLHTDFGKKFICAKDVRTKMTVGKEYKLKHMDVVEIVAGK